MKKLLSTSLITLCFSSLYAVTTYDVQSNANINQYLTDEGSLSDDVVINVAKDVVLSAGAAKNPFGIKLNGKTLTIQGDGSVDQVNYIDLKSSAGTVYFNIDSTTTRLTSNAENTVYIGKDASGNIINGITQFGAMFNKGGILAYGNTVFTGTFNVCSNTVKTYIDENVSLGTSSSKLSDSRFMYAEINGSLYKTDVQTANGWRYSLAFGVIAVKSDGSVDTGRSTLSKEIKLGATARIYNSSTTTNAYTQIYCEDFISNIDTTNKKGVFQSAQELHIYDGSKITLNTSNAFNIGMTGDSYNTQANSTFHIGEKLTKNTKPYGSNAAVDVSTAMNADVTLIVNADNDIGKIAFCYASATEKSSLNLLFGNNNLTIGDIDFYNDYCSIVLSDNTFHNDRLKFTEHDVAYWQALIDKGTISYVGDSEGALTAVATDGGVFINVVVPEPAEWAMIFGGIALAFVMYRRRA